MGGGAASSDINYTSASAVYALTCGYYAGAPISYGVGQNKITWLDVGFGDTPETPDDYQLADSNYANRKLTCVGIGKNTPALGDIFSVFANFSNDGAENVIVKEIGIVGNPTDNTTISNLCLLYRKVLDNPITIAPGEVYNFAYRIRIKS